jgi:hypothetical protein
MSKATILVCPSNVQISELSNILKERWPSNHWFTPQKPPALQIQEVVDHGVFYLSVDELGPAEEVTRDYEENDELPLKIRSQLRGKKYYQLSFNDDRLFIKAITLILSRLASHLDGMWLDNDYGVLIPARRFLEESARNPAWEWRQCAGDIDTAG